MSELFEVELKNRLEFYLSIEKTVKKHFEENEKSLLVELNNLKKQVATLESEKKGLTARNSELFKENRNLKDVATASEKKMCSAQQEALTASRQLEGIKVKTAKVEKENINLKRDVKKLNAFEPEKLKKKFNDVNQELRKNKKLLDQLGRESRERKRKLDKITTQYDELEEKYKKLEEKIGPEEDENADSSDNKKSVVKGKANSTKVETKEDAVCGSEQAEAASA